MYMYMYMYMYIGCAASEASEAIKRLQFHPFGTTFGASEAPGHGASIYDGLKVDFVIGSTKKKTRRGPTWGDPGSSWDDPGSTCPHVRMSTCPNVAMSAYRHVEMSTLSACPHVRMSTCPHVHMSACRHGICFDNMFFPVDQFF